MSQLILQPFPRFTYVTVHSPTLPSLYLCHSSFSNPTVASPTSQPILQSYFCFSYITGFSLTSPGEPPMLCWEGNEFLAQVVAGDESWCHRFKPVKWQSLQWKHPGSPPPKKSKAIHTSARKGYADVLLWLRWPPSDRLPAAQECPELLANLDHLLPSDQIETTSQAHLWGHSAPRQCKVSYSQHNDGTLAEIQVGGSRSPSRQSRPLSLQLCHFWSPK